jgi:hypothetical protein
MIHALVVIAVGAGGIAVGVLFHAWISKEVAATKAELKGWTSRIRVALDADVATAKKDITTVVQEIEKKL